MFRILSVVLVISVLALVFYRVLLPAPDAEAEPPREAQTSDRRRLHPATEDTDEPASSTVDSATAEHSEATDTSDANNTHPVQPMESYLVNEGNANVLETQAIAASGARDLRQSIDIIGTQGERGYAAFEAENHLESAVAAMNEISREVIRCSDNVCGVMFSAHDEQSISHALDRFSRDEELTALSNGGMLRKLEENSLHYGLVIMVIDQERPLKLR